MGTETKFFLSASNPATRTKFPRLFAASQIEGITHYTLLCKVVCQQGRCPLWIPHHFCSADRLTHHAGNPSLSRKCKEVPSTSSKGMQTVLPCFLIFIIELQISCKRELWCSIFSYGNCPVPILIWFVLLSSKD